MTSTQPEGELLPQVEEERSGEEQAVADGSVDGSTVSRAGEEGSEQSRDPHQHVQLHVGSQLQSDERHNERLFSPTTSFVSANQ